MPDSALNRRSEALGGWKANNASFGHQIIPRTKEMDANIVRQLVNEHLLNEAEFWLPFPIPSVAANEPSFDPLEEGDLTERCR